MISGLRLHSLCVLSICLMLFGVMTYSPDAHAGWKHTFQQKKKAVSSSYKRKKKSVSSSYKRKRKSVSSSYKRKRKSVSSSYKRKRKSVSSSYKRKRKSVSSSYKRKRKSVSSSYKRKKKSVSRRYQQKKRLATNRIQRTRSNIEKRIQKSKVLGNKTKKSLSRLGTSAGQTVTYFLEKTKGRGAKVVEKAIPTMQRIKRKVSNPKAQRRAMIGVLVATATGAAIYKHKDDIQYRLASEGMRRVKIPVNGQMRSVEDIYSEAILKEAPYLRGTAIAEDPAQILAYGVTATAKKDLLNNIDIVPNGRGGLTSVNGAVINATGADQGLAALQVGDTMEGMAVETARSGQLGHNAQIFAAAYAVSSEKIEGGN